jgi:L,D-peptidoglycan transpeptidase YkuD (ErfK/YbiS/YcfS/YnhG family)
MRFSVDGTGVASWDGRQVVCAVGRGGLCAAEDKREGDGRTPAGDWPIRAVMWRQDRLPRPDTALPTKPIKPSDGWCDDPRHPAYNRPVELPYPASAEAMWRDDDVYDLVVELGYNDDPVVPGAGSAIFLHLARPGYLPTEGCVALAEVDLRDLLRRARPGDTLCVALNRN